MLDVGSLTWIEFTRNVFCTVCPSIFKWIQCIPLMLFAHDVTNVKQIKGAADKNGLKNVTCTPVLTAPTHQSPFLSHPLLLPTSLSSWSFVVKTTWCHTRQPIRANVTNGQANRQILTTFSLKRGAIDTPVWWRWPGFKSQWIPQIHTRCYTCWPLGGKNDIRAFLFHVLVHTSIGEPLQFSLRVWWIKRDWALKSMWLR